MTYVLSNKLNGGTTVSATIFVCNSLGIDIFATGGIGGVHRNFEKTLDISADLSELGRSSVAVVSSGVKSMLDIPKTLEYLETQGVTVTTYQVLEKDFPAFYSRISGYKSPYNLNTPIEVAKLIYTSKMLKFDSSILIAVPVPEENAMCSKSGIHRFYKHNIKGERIFFNVHLLLDIFIENVIEEALGRAKSCGISGKEITPFLLTAISEITNNKSLETSNY